MNVVVCLDNENGMLFNNRRQSRDRNLIENLLFLVSDSTLYIREFSSHLFQGIDVEIDDNCLGYATKGDYCFIEDSSLKEYEDRIDSLIVYHWNRDYPADFYFDCDLSKWNLIESSEFQGSSHDKITREIYGRKSAHE